MLEAAFSVPIDPCLQAHSCQKYHIYVLLEINMAYIVSERSIFNTSCNYNVILENLTPPFGARSLAQYAVLIGGHSDKSLGSPAVKANLRNQSWRHRPKNWHSLWNFYTSFRPRTDQALFAQETCRARIGNASCRTASSRRS